MIRPTIHATAARLRAGASPWAWAIWLGLWTCLAVVYLGAPIEAQAALDDLFAVSAVVAIIVGVRWHATRRHATWHILAFGVLAMVSGSIIETAVPKAAFPGPSDALYITGYLLLALALAGFLREVSARRPSLIDAAIIVVAATSMIWTLVVDPYVQLGVVDV